MKSIPRLLVAAARDFMEDKAPRLAAALSYYTAFSLPPLLVAVIGVAGLVYGVDEVRERILAQVADLVGTDSAATLGEAVTHAQQSTGSGVALVLGLFTLLVGATGAFGQLQEALNTIWEVEPKKGAGIWRLVRSRLLSFGTILGTGFLLLVSLALSAAIGALVEVAGGFDWMAPYLAALDVVASMIVITCLFALIFKVLPDTKIEWRDVWVGAGLTAILFVAGKFAIGFYLGVSEVGSAYGAAGSIIVILVWIYYSALILFFGAEFTQVWAANRADKTATESNEPAEAESRPPSSVWATVAAALVIAWAARKDRNSPINPG
ncbi:MAG TPA: YihY/virulence factor BrkB family protein [Acidimicrobiia bacterium]|nr:YihY/virulence factor BrkB family protein [Acidimicrobiia bacterium]